MFKLIKVEQKQRGRYGEKALFERHPVGLSSITEHHIIALHQREYLFVRICLS